MQLRDTPQGKHSWVPGNAPSQGLEGDSQPVQLKAKGPQTMASLWISGAQDSEGKELRDNYQPKLLPQAQGPAPAPCEFPAEVPSGPIPIPCPMQVEGSRLQCPDQLWHSWLPLPLPAFSPRR